MVVREVCWSAVIGALAASPHLSSPLLRHCVHVSRQFVHPLPPSPPLRSSGAFLNILPVPALSLINVRLRPRAQQQGQYSPLWPPQTLIHLIVPPLIHMGKRKGPRAQHERDETEKRAKTKHLFLFGSPPPPPPPCSALSICRSFHLGQKSSITEMIAWQ